MNKFISPSNIGGRLGFLAVGLLLLGMPGRIGAQIGNNNPTGPTGVFNGNITTGCSYDPFTGNATRTVTDLVVAGGVGSYPLAFSRTANSRHQQTGHFGFGPSGGWRHSYAWEIDGSETFTNASTPPSVYPVSYPDGRVVYFQYTSSDIYFRGPPGVQERFQPLNFGTMRAYLILADGGKVEFKATRSITECDYELIPPCQYVYSYQAVAIIDPHGLRTTLTYNGDGSLNTIQEPAGRWLQLVYVTTPWADQYGWHDRVINHVQASDGRVVVYNYGQAAFHLGVPYTYLGNVVYPFEPALNLSPTALYSYQAPNGPHPYGDPLLSSCDDPMYDGPMKKISYSYATSNGDPLVAVVAGQILSENSGTTGQVVSRLYVPFITWRNEIRGDGPSRHLEYDGALLKRFTDFKNVQSSQGHDANSYVSILRDGNQNVTDIVNHALTGMPTQVTYPLTPSETVRANVKYEYGSPSCADPNNRDGNNPYYLCREINERGYATAYWRDAAKRVTQISYPDGSTETFTYNQFNQVTSHRRRTRSASVPGGLETFSYDASGKLLQYRDPYHPAVVDSQHPGIPATALPSASFGYDGLGRVSSITDAVNRSTTFQYNSRGQVTRKTHAVDGSYLQSAYNADGTLAWTADENHPGAATDPNQRKRFGYDDYKRVISAREPGAQQAATYSYAPWNGTGPYSHTSANRTQVISPLGKTTHRDYDANLRLAISRAAPQTPDDAWTYFGYDNAGNLTSVKDPRGNITNIGYDQRNRRTSVTNPAPFNNEVTRWLYDAASNVMRETRPDQSYRRIVYDSMNRVTDTYGFSNERTQYVRDLAGNVIQLIDAKNVSYGFSFDLLDRKIGASYPADVYGIQRTESWRYDTVGNIDLYCNLASQYKHIEYDSRNRPRRSYWNWSATSTIPDWFGPEVTTVFDAGGRLTSVATKLWNTNENETFVAFGYNDANAKIWEEQTLRGYPTRRVETPLDDDGNRAYLHVPGLYFTGFQYTHRSQLKSVDGFATFEYDLNGNMTRRVGQWHYPNGTSFSYDQLNRPLTVDHGDMYNFYQHNHLKFDNVGRLIATWRQEQANKGERFWYNPAGQLTGVAYNADNVSGTPSNWSHRHDFYYGAGLLNRQWVNDNGYWVPFANNAVNQYTNVNGQTPQYDGNLNLTGLSGLSASFDAENRLYHATRNGITVWFTYDGLGRCVRRTVNGAGRLFAYDGWKPMLEWDDAGNFLGWNIYGAGHDEILARSNNIIYKLDERGNVVALLGPAGHVIEKYTYDAFGKAKITDANGNVRTESAHGNRFMFQGREYIKELGIYDYRNRMYDPGLGRFLQRDPIGFSGGDANLFRYCGDDPVNKSDPYGLDPYGYPENYELSKETLREIGRTFALYFWGFTSGYTATGYQPFGAAAAGFGVGSVIANTLAPVSRPQKEIQYTPNGKRIPNTPKFKEKPSGRGASGGGGGGEEGPTGQASSGSPVTNVTVEVYVGHNVDYGSPEFHDLMSREGSFYVVDSSIDRQKKVEDID
jgi:RHS repeat-associated protein